MAGSWDGMAVGAAAAAGGAGLIVGSAALKEQAMLRDRESQNIQAQSAELEEAERLEAKAREHRERAVAQGASYPGNGAGYVARLGTVLNEILLCFRCPSPEQASRRGRQPRPGPKFRSDSRRHQLLI